jgi:hypothetical protein
VTRVGEKKGLILFIAILFIVIVVSLTAYRMTGSMGIEERYNHAVGLPGSEEEPGGGWLGFSLEGNPLLYFAVLGALAIVILAAYYRSRRC